MLTDGGIQIQNVVLLLAGLVLLAAGVVLFRRRDQVAEYLRDLRSEIFGERDTPRSKAASPGSPWIPVVVAVVLIAFGVVGAAGGLFATLPPLGTPRV